MAQKKGQTGNPAGRPKGSPNKQNKALRILIMNFCEDNFDGILKDWAELPAKERIRLYIDLLGYVLPRLENIHVSESELGIDTAKLSESAINEVIATINNKKNENSKEISPN